MKEFMLLIRNEIDHQAGWSAETKEVIVGYDHVLAQDIDDAVAIAKGNPEFEFGSTARIEVRPIKMKEEAACFVYPATWSA